MKHIITKKTTRIVTIICLLTAIAIAYCTITNWRSEYSYNAATNSLIANMKAANSTDSDKNILLTQQQQTDAQFNDARSQYAILLPQLRNSINHNAEISHQFTETLKKKIRNKPTSSPAKKSKSQNHANSKNNNQSEPTKPQLNTTQRNKVENLLQQNNHVNSQSSQDQQEQEKTTKRTTTGDNSNKPW